MGEDVLGFAGMVQAIEKIAVEGAKGSKSVEFLKPPLEPAHCYRVHHGEFLSEIIEAKPAPRQHALSDLGAVVDFCERHGNKKTVVWVGPDAVTVVLDDEQRRDKATCAMPKNRQFELIQKLDRERTKFKQQDFIKLLRIDWGPTILRLIADIDRLEARVAWLENQNREWQDYFAAKDVERLEARVAELTELVRTKDIQIDCLKQGRESQF